jgi:hypothetical protein
VVLNFRSLVVSLATVGSLALASHAQAGILTMDVTEGASTFTMMDNYGGDLDPTAGSLVVDVAFLNAQLQHYSLSSLTGTAGTSFLSQQGTAQRTDGSSAPALIVKLSSVDFVLASASSMVTTGNATFAGATFGDLMLAQSFVGASNLAFENSTSSSFVTLGAPFGGFGSVNGATVTPFGPLSGGFSMTNAQTITISGGSVTFGSSTTAQNSVPEPATLVLVGAGLIGGGVRRWRQRRRA